MSNKQLLASRKIGLIAIACVFACSPLLAQIDGIAAPESETFSVAGVELPSELTLLMQLQGPSSALELVGDQQKEMQQLLARYVSDCSKLTSLSGKKKSERVLELRRELEKDLRSILLPFQTRIWNGHQLARQGMANYLSDSPLLEGMELSKQEKLDLTKQSDEIAAKLEEDIFKLKLRAYNDLIGSLPAKQKARIKEATDEEVVEDVIKNVATDVFIQKLKSKSK